MLRRKPTAITLTTEDLSAYEDRRAHLLAQAQAQAKAQAQARGGLVTPQKTQNDDPDGELKRAPPVERPKKTREERLGIAGRS